MLDPGFQKVELIGSIKSDEIFKASCLENISWAFFRELLSFVLANILMFLNIIVCIAYCLLFLCHAIALIILLYKLLQKRQIERQVTNNLFILEQSFIYRLG